MDIISLGKANQALSAVKNLSEDIVAPQAEGRFPTVDARLDWLEGQATKARVVGSNEVDLSQGTFKDAEYQNGIIRLKAVHHEVGISQDITPTMTTFTAPSPYVVKQSGNWPGYPAWKVFDKKGATTDSWYFEDGGKGWVSLDFGTGNEKMIVKYVIVHNNLATRPPKDWTFEGSNDELNWTILDTRNGEINWGSTARREYSFTNYMKYRYYRLSVTANNGDIRGTITELEMMESTTKELFKPAGSWESPVIDLGQDWINTQSITIK